MHSHPSGVLVYYLTDAKMLVTLPDGKTAEAISRRCNNEGTHTPCQCQHHYGQVRPSGRGAQKTGSAKHRGVVGPKWPHDVTIAYRKSLIRNGWALNSAVECHLHTVEVIGSNPIAPTITYELLTSSVSRSGSRSDGWPTTAS